MSSMSIDFSSPALIVGAVAVILLICIGIAVAVHLQKEEDSEASQRFRTEYICFLRETGSGKAEEVLSARLSEWKSEDPRSLVLLNTIVSLGMGGGAVRVHDIRGSSTEADDLVKFSAVARGIPEGIDQRAEDISVNIVAGLAYGLQPSSSRRRVRARGTRGVANR